MRNNAILAHSKDNVVTVVQELKTGSPVKFNENDKENLETGQDIPSFHKVALNDINKGDDVVKYGEIIGAAIEDIKKGQHVHVNNIESKRGRGDKQ